MRKLKRVISLNYPAWRLPADLRDGLDPTWRVDIVIEEEGPEGSEYETTTHDFSDQYLDDDISAFVRQTERDL